MIRVLREGGQIVAGIAFERYPRSDCGLVTYMVVAPSHRQRGLGLELQRAAVRELSARVVFGEVLPAKLERNLRWGARIVDLQYIQPALGPGLVRDRGLILLALGGGEPLPDALPGDVVRAFLEELYAATEGGPLDPAIHIGPTVGLILAHPTAPG